MEDIISGAYVGTLNEIKWSLFRARITLADLLFLQNDVSFLLYTYM